MRKYITATFNYKKCILFFSVLWLGYLVATLFLFHRQSVCYDGQYISDMSSYIAEMQGIDSGYDFSHPLVFWIGRIFLSFTTPPHAFAFALTGLNGLCPIILKIFFNRFLQIQPTEQKKDFAVTIAVFSLMFVSSIYPPSYWGRYQLMAEGFLYRYKGVFTPNPFHNATYLASRPFALIAFFLIFYNLCQYEKINKWFRPEYLCFSITLLLSTLAKPNFTLVLSSTCGLIMVYRLLKSKGKGWKAFWQLGIYFIPTFITLLWQYGVMFARSSGKTESGIGIGFLEAWKTAHNNIPAAILLGILFPVSVTLFQIVRKGKNSLLIFSWQYFLMSLVQLVFFYEKGYRFAHMNFAWGYMYGMVFTYAVSLAILIKETSQKHQPSWMLTLQWLIYALHFICGVDYFRVVVSGGLYL